MGYWGNRKPPIGTPIDPSHPLAMGLIADYRLDEGGGATACESWRIGGLELAIVNANPTNTAAGWQPGPRYVFADAGGFSYARVATPAALKLGFPLTLVWQGSIDSSASGTGGYLFGCSYSNNQSSPYDSYGLVYGSGGTYGMQGNSGGTHWYPPASPTTSVGVVHQIAGRAAPSGFAHSAMLWVDGKSAYSWDPSLSSAPTYATGGAPSQFGFGEIDGGGSSHAQATNHFGRLYSRALADAEIEWSYAEPYDLYLGPRRPRSVFAMSAAPSAFASAAVTLSPLSAAGSATASSPGGSVLTADRHTLPRHRKNVAIDVRGDAAGTSWTQGGTTFNLSGSAATGSSITTKIVNSATYARLVLTVADIDGDLTISDGTNSVTLAVHYIPRWPSKGWVPGM